MMKKSQLRKIIKEEISKELKESNLSIEEDENIDELIRLLEQAVYSARQLQINGETRDMDFGSLVDSLRDELRGFEQ
tara:strand:- start:312 stop:542 length:231 start_codon:yes stop_codon:yes gene_type:complete